MITKLRLRNFRGFRAFDLSFQPFTALVGLNNAGKTTILRSLAMLLACSENIVRRTKAPPISLAFASPELLRQAGFGREELVTFGGTTGAAHIEATLESGGVQFEFGLAIPEDTKKSGLAELKIDGQPVKEQVTADQTEKLAEVQHIFSTTALQGFLPIMEPESQIPYEQLQAKLKNGDYFGAIRNQLDWWFDGKPLSARQQALARVMAQLSDIELNGPQRSRTGNTIEIHYTEDQNDLEISHSGAGQRTLLNIAAAVELSTANVILIDEPDAHLHPGQQRELARWLSECATPERQIIVACHGPDFIDECDLESIRWIDRRRQEGSTPSRTHSVLAELGAVRRSAIPSNDDSKAVTLFVEGPTDRKPYRMLLSKSRSPAIVDQLRIEPIGGSGDFLNLPRVALLTREFILPSFRVAAIRDADFESTDARAEFQVVDGTFLGRLPCKEIENLFVLDAHALLRAMKDEAERRAGRSGKDLTLPTEAEIEMKLDEISGSDEVKQIVTCEFLRAISRSEKWDLNQKGVIEKCHQHLDDLWTDSKWRRRHAPGKEMLKRFRNWCSSTFGLNVISHESICKHLSISDDVEKLFEELEKFVLGNK